ncbi:hypothetical protein ACQ4PT_026537 [Festuca glaucescens]
MAPTLQDRFRGVLPEDPDKPYEEFAHSYGIPFSWLCRFKLENMAANADDNQVARHLEAFLLWLFGRIMFTRSKGDIVDNWFIEFAKEIADAPQDPGPEDLPKYSWGSALLCAMYRALCRGGTKSRAGSRLDGCPLFLQLWSFERFQIGRPKVETQTYGPGMYGKDDVDAPTFGSLWCSKKFPVALGDRLDPCEHTLGKYRKWAAAGRMAPWVSKWELALEDVLREERPYDPGSYQGYLEWYTPRTCLRLLPVVEPPLPWGIQPPAPDMGMQDSQAGVNLHLVHDLAVEVEGDVRGLRERIRDGLGPTQPAEMEAALEQVSEKARRIVALSASQQLPELATGTSTQCQPYEASSPDLQTGCSAWQEPEEPME